MIEPASVTRTYDSGHAIGGHFSKEAVLIVNPEASRADVLALALERAAGLYDLADVLSCCTGHVGFEVNQVAGLLLGPAEDVKLLLQALQRMDRESAS